jgi:hypothetical protein
MILKYIIFFILLLLVATNFIIFSKLTKSCIHLTKNQVNVSENFTNANISNLIERVDILNDDIIDFEVFDNKRGAKMKIIPNIVHLIYLNLTKIAFYQAINIYSVYLNQKPDRIYIHCDLCNFTGYYWSEINSVTKLKQLIKINKINVSRTVFDVEYGWIQHKYFISFYENILKNIVIIFLNLGLMYCGF